MTSWSVMLLLAQIADPLAGGAGWASFGIAGMVLAWLLLKHLPAKDTQIEKLLATQDVQIQQLAALFRQEGKEAREEFKVALASILAHCERETGKMADAVRTEIKLLRTTSPGLPTGQP